MGSRANYVLVDADGWRLHYSHWGAQDVDVQLAAGPDAAVAFAQAQDRVEPPEGWLDDTWAEGGFLIDVLRRRVLYFGGFEFLHELPYRRAYRSLLRRTWPADWTLDWAYRRLAELIDYVGQDPTLAVVPELMGRRGPTKTYRAAQKNLAEGWWYLVSVRDAKGRVQGFATSGALTHPFSVGTRLLSALAQSGAELAEGVAVGAAPLAGVHVGLGAQRVGWWSLRQAPVLLATATQLWPAWRVEFWEDAYERHLAESGLVLPAVDVQRGFDRLQDRLLRAYAGYRDPVDVALETVESLRTHGHEVEVIAPITAHIEVERGAAEQAFVRAALAAARRTAGFG